MGQEGEMLHPDGGIEGENHLENSIFCLVFRAVAVWDEQSTVGKHGTGLD